MITTRVHAEFWMMRQSMPAFVRQFLRPAEGKGFTSSGVTIDACINAHAGEKRATDHDLAVHNLLALCRGYRRRGVLLVELQRIAMAPGTVSSPEKRAAFALKWSRRIERQRKGLGKAV